MNANVLLMIVVISGVLAFESDCANAQDTETARINVETMHATWHKRQTAIQSLSVAWRQKTSVSQDWIRERPSRRRLLDPPNEQDTGDAKLKYDQRHVLALSEQRISWKTTGFGPGGRSAVELRPIADTRVFDGAKFIWFGLVGDFEGGRFPQAVLSPDRNRFTRDETLFPILLNLRPLDHDLKSLYDLTAFKPTEGEEARSIAGRNCFRLVSGKRSIWVAPDADYSIVRYAWMKDDMQSASLETTIDVERSPEGVFAPTKWSTEKPGAWNSKIAVHSLEINPKIDDSEFSIVFPTNTLVIDCQLAGDTTQSIVRADGSLVSIKGARTYKEALEKANSEND